MPWYFDLARKQGVRLTHWWAQAAELMGACPAHPEAASPALGGAEMFRAMNQQAKASGMTAGYYFNTQLYTRPYVVGAKWFSAQPMADLEPEAQRPPLMLTREVERDLEVRPLNGTYAYAYWEIGRAHV